MSGVVLVSVIETKRVVIYANMILMFTDLKAIHYEIILK